jgi:hypothetical protein
MNSAGFLALGMALVPGLASAASVCEVRSGAGTGALLELYTSEGCSSCPPADRWFAGLGKSQDLNLLAFHVDYWDEIGWPDRFAQHAFTVRQGQRVRTGGSTTVYTPQVMLSSRLDLRWYKPDQVQSALADVQRQPAAVALQMRAQPVASQWRVDLQATPVSGSGDNRRLYLALYENGLSSSVKAGENAGVTLHHERVVRGLWGPWPLASTGAARQLLVTPPKNALAGTVGLTAFVQDVKTGETQQAVSLPLDRCVAANKKPLAP